MSTLPNTIYFVEDNLPVLEKLHDDTVDLIYIDPPFNTGKKQSRTRIKNVRSAKGDRVGFNGNNYKTTVIGTQSYNDIFEEYIEGFLRPRLEEAYRILKPTGTLYFHIDYREVHNCKLMLDEIFGVLSGKGDFLNEIIWAYDYGGKSKKKWPAKHDNILVYVKDKNEYTYNQDYVNNLKFRIPSHEGAKNISQSDTWWHTIVPTNGSERTGYPTQKPIGILDRIILASSKENDLVLDFFAGSGTTGESCLKNNRRFILIDNNIEAKNVMSDRFMEFENQICWVHETS